MRKRRRPSDLESQRGASGRYTGWPNVLPSDYPSPSKPTRPRYQPWPNTLPRDYPNAPRRLGNRNIKPDLRVIERASNAKEIAGSIRPKPFVLSNFDARPINCIDFIRTFSAAEQVGGTTFTTTFIIPEGRTAIIRQLSLRVYMDAVARDAVSGAPTQALSLRFAINGDNIEQNSLRRVDDAICSPTWQTGLTIPLYFIVPASQSFTMTLVNTTATANFALVAPVITGNLLLAEGVNPSSEPGTQWPLPTRAL